MLPPSLRQHTRTQGVSKDPARSPYSEAGRAPGGPSDRTTGRALGRKLLPASRTTPAEVPDSLKAQRPSRGPITCRRDAADAVRGRCLALAPPWAAFLGLAHAARWRQQDTRQTLTAPSSSGDLSRPGLWLPGPTVKIAGWAGPTLGQPCPPVGDKGAQGCLEGTQVTPPPLTLPHTGHLLPLSLGHARPCEVLALHRYLDALDAPSFSLLQIRVAGGAAAQPGARGPCLRGQDGPVLVGAIGRLAHWPPGRPAHCRHATPLMTGLAAPRRPALPRTRSRTPSRPSGGLESSGRRRPS